MHQTVSGHTVRLIVKALGHQCPQHVPALLAELQIAPAMLSDREAQISKSTMDTLWERALELSGDDGFGLSLATLLAPGMLGAVDFLFRNMGTLGEAYRQAIRFQNLLQQNTSRWTLTEQEQQHWCFRYELLPPVAKAHRHIVEFAFASFVGLGRQVAASSWAPAAVSFAHARGTQLARYRDAFGVTPSFSQAAHELWLSTDSCALEVVGADGHLAEIVRHYADRRQSELACATTADAVRRNVTELMQRGDVSLRAVARGLSLSERTLRRRLSGEGVSFQALVDEVRYEAAQAYLDQDRLSTAEIALLLGFSEVGAFYRAFRRWHGASLSAYRSAQSAR